MNGRLLAGRRQSGAAGLMAVLLLAATAAVALAFDGRLRQAEERAAAWHEAGLALAAWTQAAHRRGQGVGTAAIGETFAAALFPAAWRPAGLRPDPAGLEVTVGWIADGSGSVPQTVMAFIVASGAPPDAADDILAGARQGGLRALSVRAADEAAWLAVAADVDDRGLATRHLAAVETAAGEALADGDIWTTADLGLPYRTNAVHRRPQPGRQQLARMETDLCFRDHADAATAAGDPCHVDPDDAANAVRAGEPEGGRGALLRAGGFRAAAPFSVAPSLVVRGPPASAGVVAGFGSAETAAGSLVLNGDAASLTAASLGRQGDGEGAVAPAPVGTVTVAGSLGALAAARIGGVTVTGAFAAPDGVAVDELAGDAAEIDAEGAVRTPLAVGVDIEIETSLGITGTCNGCP